MLNRSRSEVLNLAVALKGTGSDHQDRGKGKRGDVSSRLCRPMSGKALPFRQ